MQIRPGVDQARPKTLMEDSYAAFIRSDGAQRPGSSTGRRFGIPGVPGCIHCHLLKHEDTRMVAKILFKCKARCLHAKEGSILVETWGVPYDIGQ